MLGSLSWKARTIASQYFTMKKEMKTVNTVDIASEAAMYSRGEGRICKIVVTKLFVPKITLLHYSMPFRLYCETAL